MKRESSCDEASVCDQVRSLYSELASQPEKDFGWDKGKNNARALGYEPAYLEQLPDAIWESSAAVGNPFSLGQIGTGETVVDLGCGAGSDACVAALLVGPEGRVIGVDLTPAMVTKARANAALAGVKNATFREADMAELSLPDSCADVVISNGAINLSAHKRCVLKETFRVLKPGGRLYIADMVRDESVEATQPDTEHGSGSWADCVTGTLRPGCFIEMLEVAGFVNVEFVTTTGYRTAPQTIGATFRARKPDLT